MKIRDIAKMDAFFENIAGIQNIDFDLLNDSELTQLSCKVAKVSFKETLHTTAQLLQRLEKIISGLNLAGFRDYISEYDHAQAHLILNAHLNRDFLPKNMWFIHDDLFPHIQKNLESFVDIEAIKNIQRHAQIDEDSAALIKLPLVTVAITNYNYEKYLEHSIQSVLDLNYPNIQRIIIDDASVDGSAQILQKYEQNFEIVRHQTNKGQLAGFFSVLDIAKGEFLVFVDADDMLDPESINIHLAVHLYSKPYVSFTCARNRQISDKGSILSNYHMDLQTNSEKVKYVRPRFIHTPTWSWSTTSAMMFRTDMLRLIKTDNTDAFRVCADYYIVNFSNLLGASMLIDTVVSSYRRHGNNNFSKNFIIGGHKPTGHLKYHGHPEHSILLDEIISKMLGERSKIEPYFGSLAHYCTILSYVKPPSELLKMDELPQDIAGYLRKNSRSINWEFRKQKYKIQIKNWYAKKSCFLKSLKSFKDFFNTTYCEK